MSGDQPGLRTLLADVAEDVRVVDMRTRVRVAQQRRRRRRAVAVVAAAVGSVAVIGASVQLTDPEPPPPAKRAQVIDLAAAPTGVPDAAQLVLVHGDGQWAIAADGRAVRLQMPGFSNHGAPTLSADGTTIVQESPWLSETTRTITLRRFGSAPRTVEVEPVGPDLGGRLAYLSPDGRTVAVLVPAISADGPPPGVQLVDTGGEDATVVRLPTDLAATIVGGFSRDGGRFLVVAPDGTSGVVDVERARLNGTAELRRTASTVFSEHGGVISPDLRRVLLPRAGWRDADGRLRENWVVADVTTGEVLHRLDRPEGHVPLAWTSDNTLVWGSPVGSDYRYDVLTTAPSGKGQETIYRILLDPAFDGEPAALYARNQPAQRPGS